MSLYEHICAIPATRRDGWSPELKVKFLDHLSAKGTVRAACALVGMSREAAYRLRRRDPLFARGWAAALAQAREHAGDELAVRAIDGIEEEVWYRGEIVGTRRRYDSRLLLAHLARLDRQVQEGPANEDASRFDELLALVGGEQAPEELACEDGDTLPLDRESFAQEAAEAAHSERRWLCYDEEEWEEQEEERNEAGELLLKDPEKTSRRRELRAFELDKACEAEAQRAREEAGAQWDAWFRRACERVDILAPPPPLIPAPGAPRAPHSPPRTVSMLSTSG